jgi:biopolymer transport protein ExbD
MKHRLYFAGVVALALAACSREPPVVHEMRVSIDASNDCFLDEQPVACQDVAAAIKTKYPTSTPRVDICLAKETRFEAATEVVRSVEAAGFPVGTMDCSKPPAAG